MNEDITFKTSNEIKEFKKPKIKSGEYEFKVFDVKQSSDKSRINFILEIKDQVFEEEPVRLVWSAPTNDEYSPKTNVGQLLLAMGFDLGTEIRANDLIDKVGKCVVQDYSKQVDKKVVTYSVIGELIIPTE